MLVISVLPEKFLVRTYPHHMQREVNMDQFGPWSTGMTMYPAGKVAIVTGGSKGIGFECTHALLRSGAQITICGVDKVQGERVSQTLNAECGEYRVHYIECDVTNSEQFENVFKQTINKFGGVHILVNNAGIFDEDNWEKMIAVNLTAVVRGTLLAFEYMDKSHGGVVVNISSVAGLESLQWFPIYAATKRGVIGFSTSFNDPFNCHTRHVRVVVLCPGLTCTNIFPPTIEKGQDLTRYWAFALRAPNQAPDKVARGLIHVLRHAANGSVWVVEGGGPTHMLRLPDYHTLKNYDEEEDDSS